MSGVTIIGAGPMIGLSVAHRFAREGMTVSVIARSSATVGAAVASLAAAGARVTGMTADGADEASLRAALDAVTEKNGVPDVLIYNAGVIRADRPGELSATELLQTFAVNAVGAMSAGAHVGEQMAKRGSGTILITGGMPELSPEYTSLSLGKAGVRAVTALLAAEYGPRGVHVATVTVADAVAPGTSYSPDNIAEEYWQLSQQPPADWDEEVIFRP